MALADLVSEYVPAVDGEMAAVLASSPGSQRIAPYLRYHLGWVDQEFQPLGPAEQRRYGGKRLRPILCLLAYRSARDDWQRALPAAAVVELIQNFTLIHDDVEDNDPERRHRPTVWKLWGVPHAINAGSHMQALVNAAALRLTACGVADAVVLEAVRLLTDCILELTDGQYLDISYEGRFDVTLDDYFTMTGGKTGALFELSCRLGALLARTDDPEFVDAWSQVGRSFGLAFQARDDTLGVWEKSAATGKVQAGDILKRKKSLPIVYALTHGSAQERQTIIDVFSQPDLGPSDVERVVQVLDRCGAPEYCARIMQEQGRQALAALDRLPDVPAVAQVRGLVEQVLAG